METWAQTQINLFGHTKAKKTNTVFGIREIGEREIAKREIGERDPTSHVWYAKK